jgi:hypothetical protein
VSGFDSEQRLILLSSSTEARRTGAAGRQVASGPPIDWVRLNAMLSRARLLPTLGPRIVELAGDAVPEGFAAEAAEAVLACQRQDALLELSGARVEAALVAAGIRAGGLKGPALGEAIYGEPGRRLSSDIDLLVEPEQLGDAVAVVRELGYGRPTDPVESDGLPLLHFALAHERGELPPVELHWRVHWYETRFARERLLPPANHQPEWRPAPADELAALLLFYARDGFTGLRQATDLGAWWDRFGDSLAPGALEEVAGSYPQLAPAIRAASRVTENAVGMPVSQLFDERNELGGRARIAVRLADPRPYASEAQLFAEIGLIDGLLTPPGSLQAYLRRQVAPPLEVIQDHAEKARARKLGTPFGYGIRILGRYALAFGRLLGVPFTARARFLA